MTTPEAIYKTALEHIRDGSDAVCTQCGWIGPKKLTVSFFARLCPLCGCESIRIGNNHVAAYALAQGGKGE